MSSALLPPPSQTRLVTIVAHVDHGKTTLADNLIESNGIIGERLAGTIRYLDFDEEEQRRGITMRTSTIALRHFYTPVGGNNNKEKKKKKKKERETMVVHLLDSPGHVDFAPEVTTSLLLADTALLVIDVVEGMCARTHSILREAHAHSMKPILIINKMDRLCGELRLSLKEAYVRIRALLESVNAVCANMVMRSKLERLEQQQQQSSSTSATASKVNINAQDEEEEEDEETQLWTFSPSSNNVIFASALHGWGFTIPSLARHLFKTKVVQVKPLVLKQLLFDDNVKYRHTDHKVLKRKKNTNDEEDLNLFEEFALKPIWDIYECVGGVALTAIAMSGGGGGGYDTNGYNNAHTTTPGNHNTATNNHNNKTKITADTPGMEEILTLLQSGHTSPNTTTHDNTKYSMLSIPTTKEQLQILLNKTGASSSSNEEILSRTLLRRYRPLSTAVLDCVCEIGYNPKEAIGGWRRDILSLNEVVVNDNDENDDDDDDDGMILTSSSMVPTTTIVPTISPPSVSYPPFFIKAHEQLSSELSLCNPSSSVVMAHVTKFLVTDPSSVTDPKQPASSSNNETNDKHKHKKSIIMGLARVLSGTIYSNQDYHVFGPRYKPTFDDNESTTSTTSPPPTRNIKLYLLMGSSFIQVPSVPAGHICAIYNLEDLQYKSVTLCNTYDGMMSFGGGTKGLIQEQAKRRPLVKVNVEAVSSADTDRLEKGLVKLCLADPAVEVIATSKGERILSCLGEIHLEQSILDLKRTYCRRQSSDDEMSTATHDLHCGGGEGKGKDHDDNAIELRISEPIVEFGESTTWFEKECKSNTTGGDRGGDRGGGYISNDYTKFFNNDKKEGPVRQVTIPPYCDEEGLKYAQRGRSRCILSGRCAALSVRVVPLSRGLYNCLRSKRVILDEDEENNKGEDGGGGGGGGGGGEESKNSVEDILEMGSALKCEIDSTNDGGGGGGGSGSGSDGKSSSNVANAQSILNILSKAICHIDSNGNAFIESRGITNGECVKAVLSDNGEVYVPPSTIHQGGDSTTSTGMTHTASKQQLSDRNNEENGEGDEIGKEGDSAGKDVYDDVQYRIGQGGLMGMKEEEEEGENDNNNQDLDSSQAAVAAAANTAALEIWKTELRGSAVAGFQLAMRAGALCEEPIRGVLVILEGVEIAMKKKKHVRTSSSSSPKDDNVVSSLFQSAKPLSGGMIVAALRSGIRCALLTRPARLVEGHLRLTLHSSFTGLGPLYAVLTKRRGKVISDDMVDGTDLIRITASIPQAESFHLSPELLEESSGEVTAPELVFSHWGILEEDPFWIPTSLEEREDYGEIIMNGDSSTGLDNNALKYIRMVRGRKGLLVDSSKIVVAAEKQRTLARKK